MNLIKAIKLFITAGILLLSFNLCGEIIFSENFENSSDWPEGWSTLDANDTGDEFWIMTDGYGHNGSSNYLYLANNCYGDKENWVFMPLQSVQTGDTLSFYGHYDSSGWGPEILQIKVSSGGNSPTDFTYQIAETEINSDEWVKYKYDLSEFDGQDIYLALVCVTPGDNGYYLYLDDFEITRSDDEEINNFAITENFVTGQAFAGLSFAHQITLKNTGNTDDVYNFSLQSSSELDYDVTDEEGNTVTEISLSPQESKLISVSSFIEENSSLVGETENLTIAFTSLNDEELINYFEAETVINASVNQFPYVENFDSLTPPDFADGWTVINANNDAYPWITAEGDKANSSPNYAKVRYNATQAADDWLITPAVLLEAGQSYQINFSYRENFGNFTEKFSFFVGDNALVDAMTTQLFIDEDVTETEYQDAAIMFTPSAAGAYFFGWHCYSDADQAAFLLDDFQISSFEEEIDLAVTGISSNKTSIEFGEEIVFSATLRNNGNSVQQNIGVNCFVENEVFETITTDELGINAETEISFTYTGAIPEGMKTFRFELVSEDDDNTNNFAEIDFETVDPNIPPTESPIFSHESGFYSPFELELSCTDEEAQIYYTEDGSEPTTESQVYSSPIAVDESKTVKAFCKKTGVYPSEIVTKEYITEETTLLPYNCFFPEGMNLSESWKSMSGILSENSDLTPDWTAWILDEYLNEENSENFAAETVLIGDNTKFWLISPPFVAEPDESFTLRFKFALTDFDNSDQASFAEGQKFKVLISSDDDWSSSEVVFTLDENSDFTNGDEIEIPLTVGEQNFKIAFYAESTNANIPGSKEIFVDDFKAEFSDKSFAAPVNPRLVCESDDVSLSWDKPGENKETDLIPTDDMYSNPGDANISEAQLMVANQSSCGYFGRTMVKFDLSGIDSEKFISAEFNIKEFYAAGCIPFTPVSVYAINEEWNENDWDSNVHIGHSDQVWATIMLDSAGWKTIDLTELATAWLNNEIPNYGFVMVAEDACAASKFFSKDSANSDEYPYLKIKEEQTSSRELASITGYNVYRNNELLNFVAGENVTEFVDNDLEPGTYNYSVCAVYDEYLSVRADFPEITVESLPNISVSADSVYIEIQPDSAASFSFDISNTGGQELTWSIISQNADNRALGDVIASWEVPDEISNPWGLGFDNENNTIWLTDIMQMDGGAQQLTEVSKTGEFIRELECPWIELWLADLCVTGDYILAMSVSGGGNEKLCKVDKNTGELVAEITGEWSCQVTHGVAYDPAADEYYIGGWWHEVIYHTDGEGNTINTIPVDNTPNVAGLAWHPGGNNGAGSLWITGTQPYMIYEMNPETGEILHSAATPNDVALYGLEIGDDGSLWAADCTGSEVYNIESGVGLNNVEWLTFSPESGSIPGGNSVTIDLQFSSENCDEGDYSAYLQINHNVENTEPISIPILMRVSSANDTEIVNQYAVSLGQNYPNPFNPTTNISFTLERKEQVNIVIYNVKGQHVKTLTKEVFEAGKHVLQWNGTDDNDKKSSSGVYFYKMEAGNFKAINKMLLMK
ncbi:MAG: hypothetical protein CSB55_08145 [Candidatus Cloacimonadota bacterium]|nr:MAG: hypothetical protein CSB55_08145 [Candidatus Cloacimonadota bacterium]